MKGVEQAFSLPCRLSSRHVSGSQFFLPLALLLAPLAFAQSLPDLYHDERRGDPPYLTEPGWHPLLNGRDLTGWHPEGSAPDTRPPGEWQSLRIWFQAPQFDAAGMMIAKPKIARVILNDVPVQENFTLPGPTLSHLDLKAAARNPIMLQGDHGPVAFRNIYIKPLE